MPLPREVREKLALERAHAEEAADRLRNRDVAVGMLLCVGWAALGIFLVMWSAHTTDLGLGRMAFFGGIGVGNGGVIFTLLSVWRRGERRGDW